MKRIVLLCLVWGCAVASIRAELSIKQVVLFRDRAEIERNGVVALTNALTRVDVHGMPWELDSQSIRAFVSDAGAAVQRIEITPVHSRLIREEEAAELKDGVKELQATIDDLNTQSGRLHRQIGFMETLTVGPRPHDPDEAPPPVALVPDKWLGVLDFVGDTMNAYGSELEGVNQRIEDATVEMEVFATKLDRLTSKDVKQYKDVAIYVKRAGRKEITLSLTYMVSGPQWFPRYEARADADSGKVQLTAFALVRQRTGEDWTDAELTFSTVDLNVSAALPKIPVTRISPAGMLRAEPVVTVGKLKQVQVFQSDRLSQKMAVENQGRFSLSSLKRSLDSQRGQLTNIRNQMPMQQTQKINANVSSGPAIQGAEQRYVQLRALYNSQQEDLQAGKYREFGDKNKRFQHLWNTLPEKGQKALSVLNDEAGDNLFKAQRLMKSRELEKNLKVPMSAVGGLDYRFDALGSANVYSEWVLTKVRYLDTVVDAEFVYEAAPLHKELFYLIATGDNHLGQPLLPGPMAVFVGRDFVGESALPMTASGQRMRFELGADRDVSITRRVQRQRDTRGFVLQRYRYDYVVTIHAINHKPKPVKIKVFDRYPYTKKNAHVDVGGFTAEPQPSSVSSYHQLRWDQELPPNKKSEIAFTYDLAYRSNLAVTGQEGGGSW
jgi:hypothetical protein